MRLRYVCDPDLFCIRSSKLAKNSNGTLHRQDWAHVSTWLRYLSAERYQHCCGSSAGSQQTRVSAVLLSAGSTRVTARG